MTDDSGRLIAGRYRLVQRIGSGAMGVVYRAEDERLGRTVAVKQLLLAPGLPPDEADEAVQRCMREGRIAAKLHHPNAITVYDVVDADGAPILIMEYLQSVSLADALDQRGTLPPREVARIGAHVAAALAAAHAAGIVHRDIKPGNILLGGEGTVKITDFGISRATDDVTVTKTGMIAGTPAYLAPEVAIGRQPEAAADVFSLGSTLYAATEGEPPFGLSENTLGVLHAVAAGRINPPRRSGPLTDVLTALLSADPLRRPTTEQARELLDAVANGQVPRLDATAAAIATELVNPLSDTTEMLTHQDGPTQRMDPRTQRLSPGTRPIGAGTRPGSRPLDPVGSAPVAGRRSRTPLIVGAVALAALLAIGGWLLATSGSGDQQDQSPAAPPSSSAPHHTTSAASTTTDQTQVKQTSTERETTTENRQTTTTTTTDSTPVTTTTVPTTTQPGTSVSNPSSGPSSPAPRSP